MPDNQKDKQTILLELFLALEWMEKVNVRVILKVARRL